MTEIAGKTAVVTGGSSGIGRALARQLARDGARVAIADIMIDSARAVAEDINAEGGDANPIPLYEPDGIAPIVLQAVRNNRSFVFDHAEQRQAFRDTYASIVESCYDNIEVYEREFGTLAVVRRVNEH